MNRIAKFFHEISHPHCSECREEKTCSSCETLRNQLELANEDKKKLLEIILERNKVSEAAPAQVDYKPLRPSPIPWNTRRRLLEAEDREAARLMKSHQPEQKEVDKLEKELGIATGTEKGSS